jgi:hypothetical protein
MEALVPEEMISIDGLAANKNVFAVVRPRCTRRQNFLLIGARQQGKEESWQLGNHALSNLTSI